MKLLAGNSNRTLAEAVAAHLDLPLTKAQVKRLSDLVAAVSEPISRVAAVVAESA